LPKRVLIIGSTGSIGESTLKVLKQHRRLFSVAGLTAHSRWERLVQQALEFRPHFVHVAKEHFAATKAALDGQGIEVHTGRQALIDLPSHDAVDILLSAIVGTRGLEPLLTAIRAGRQVCFANKEPLVTAGSILMKEARDANVPFIPVDSEHSAILQCLQGEDPADVERVILTASGGPFRQSTLEEFSKATRQQALKHPTWTMGAKITIDSATLMNKALEVIEAAWLYDLPEHRVEVMVHPQSIVHSMVEFRDRSVKAQLGLPDMQIPILYALAWPRHLDLEMPRLDMAQVGRLDFEPVDNGKFRALNFAREAFRKGEGWPCVMNAANEAAVELLLRDQVSFGDLYGIIESELNAYQGGHESLEALIELDQTVRQRVLKQAK
jgi:1-deoxy-D-xylulose-5-phosphate reductoisomerase